MPAGALERAVGLLHHLGDQPAEVTVAALATEAGMPTSTAYRLLGELEQLGLVSRAGNRVALGTRLVALGRTAEAGLRERVVEPAEPVMTELSRQTAETVILTAPCALEAIVLHVVETEVHSVRLSYAVFRRGPIHRGASGKVLAAFLDAPERRRLLEAVADPQLTGELEQIRAAGFVMTVGELDDGAAAVAAPILDRRGRLIAGLSIAGPAQRIVADATRLAPSVQAAAARIERLHHT